MTAIPKPVKTPLANGTAYYVLNLSGVTYARWYSEQWDFRWLAEGRIFLSEATAEAARKGLESLWETAIQV